MTLEVIALPWAVGSIIALAAGIATISTGWGPGNSHEWGVARWCALILFWPAAFILLAIKGVIEVIPDAR